MYDPDTISYQDQAPIWRRVRFSAGVQFTTYAPTFIAWVLNWDAGVRTIRVRTPDGLDVVWWPYVAVQILGVEFQACVYYRRKSS